MRRIILASASPRRQELLAALVREFEVVPADIPEPLGDDPRADAVHLATGKACEVAKGFWRAVVIGSDTVVHDALRSYGKPEDADDARTMLARLRGREHTVTTGVAVVADGEVHAGASEARVLMHNLEAEEIDAYVASGRPLDKAGGYAIQDNDVPTVDSIDGCYCCVVGLPLWRLRGLLEKCGVRCGDPGDTYERCRTCPDREPPA